VENRDFKNRVYYNGHSCIIFINIGTIDEIQKLHIRTIPLGETPRRITYQEQTQTFGVLTMRHDIHGKDGLTPSRSSASTLTQSTTASSSLGALGPRPSGHGTATGGLQMEQEQEVR
jgi:DNA damage-binding protein 1